MGAPDRQAIFDLFFGENKLQGTLSEEPQEVKRDRTPVELSGEQALRMRCVELVLEQWEEGKKIDWFEVKRSAVKLATFVQNGF